MRTKLEYPTRILKQSSATYLCTRELASEYAVFIALSVLVNPILENLTKHKRALIKVSKTKTVILLNAFEFPILSEPV